MATSWEYAKRVAQRSEALGYDLTLIAELFMNDIKGPDAPALDAGPLRGAWRPTFHQPAILAKQAANIDQISGGRLSLNVVSSWWADEARRYGVHFEEHDDRYARTDEWLSVVRGAWCERRYSHHGKYYQVDETILEPKPVHPPTIYDGGESDAVQSLIARA